MASITEDLLALLLDNDDARPALGARRRRRVLAAAVVLDLAHARLVRPTAADDLGGAGRLVALLGPDPADPVLTPTLRSLRRHPASPAALLGPPARLVEPRVRRALVDAGRVTVRTRRRLGVTRAVGWPAADRTGVDAARADVLAALFDGAHPTPTAVGVIALLHSVDGLGALLALNDRGWRHVHDRASVIAAGGWLRDDSPPAERNLAATVVAVRPALA